MTTSGVSRRVRLTESEDSGPAAERLVFLPGFAQAASWWEEVSNLTGRPSVLVETPTGLQFAETAEAIIRYAGRGIYVGYSQGGRLALQIALHTAGVATGIVVVSTGAGLGPAAAAERQRSDEELARFIESHPLEDFYDRWLAQPLFEGRDPTRALQHRLSSTRQIAEQLRHLGQGSQAPLWARLGQIQVPALVIAGEQDRKYSAIARRLVNAIGSNASLVLVPQAGHAVPESHPEELARLLRGFCDDL